MMYQLFQFFAAACQPKGSVFGIPTWYKYLPGQDYVDQLTNEYTCTPKLNSISDVWLIGAAILDILLRIAALLAVGYIVVAGVNYIRSQGQPDQTAKAQRTLINAIVGLVIAVASAVLVSFVAGRFN